MGKGITVIVRTKDGEEESRECVNDYVLVTEGDCYLDGVQTYGNGTVVLTIKNRSRPARGKGGK